MVSAKLPKTRLNLKKKTGKEKPAQMAKDDSNDEFLALESENDYQEYRRYVDFHYRDIKEEEYRRAYSQALHEGEAKNNRIPIMLVGQDRGGKTSLMRRLLGLPFEKDQPSTVGIDVNVIELTEQNAEDPWKKREAKKFMTSEAKTALYKKTAEYLDRGVPRNLEEDAPEPLKPVMPVKPLSREEISKIKLQRSTEYDQNEVLRLFVSDFAGQSIYYDIHGCFVKPHCPYVLVHDASLEFDKPAVPKFKTSNEEEEIEMNNSYLNTNLDNFTSWLKFLQGLGEFQDQQFPDKSGHYTTAKGEKFKLPPVLIALTNSDKAKGNDVQNRIKNILYEGKYQNVMPEFFVIDNTLEDDDGDDGDDVRKLRRKLFDLSNAVLNHEILMPVKWLDFEAALSQKLSPDCKYIPVDEAKREAQTCGVGEFDQAIKFLHRQGVVVHYSGSSKVVLNPPWLMNRFAKVISMPGKLDALSRHALDVFKQKGILFREDLQNIFRISSDAELLEELMQKFNLICPCQHEGEAAFYVPSVAPAMTPGRELEASNVPSLYVRFPRKLVPISLFTKLQVKLISEWGRRFPNQQVTPSFYCNYSLLPLIIDGDLYDVRLIDFHEFIKVAVFPKQDGNHFKFASHLLATLKKCLDDLKSPDQLLFSMTSYDLEVKCTCCFGKEERCSRHGEIQCLEDRCGHFWKLSELQDSVQPSICLSNKHSPKVFDIKSVKIWLNTDTIRSQKSTRKRKKPMLSKERPMSNKVPRSEKRGKSVGMISLKNKDDDEPTYTVTIGSQKPTQKRKKKLKRLSSTNSRRLSSKGSPGGNNKSHAVPVKMCGSCEDKTPLSSDRDKWPIDKIEIGCFHQICKLLDLAVLNKELLMSALGGFDQTEVACIKTKYETRGGLGTAEEVLSKWGSSDQENNNVGALKKILKDNMRRDDVVVEIGKWENLRVCHGCGIKLNKPH